MYKLRLSDGSTLDTPGDLDAATKRSITIMELRKTPRIEWIEIIEMLPSSSDFPIGRVAMTIERMDR